MTLKVVLTGGPGAGKSMTLDALAKLGMTVATDHARSIIQERKERGLSPRPELSEFARSIFERDRAAFEHASTSGNPLAVFFERGIVDSVGFLTSLEQMTRDEAAATIRSYPYFQSVFAFPPWPEIYRADAERDQTFTESVSTYKNIVMWYQTHGYKVIEVPKGPVNFRAEFVLKEAGLSSAS